MICWDRWLVLMVVRCSRAHPLNQSDNTVPFCHHSTLGQIWKKSQISHVIFDADYNDSKISNLLIDVFLRQYGCSNDNAWENSGEGPLKTISREDKMVWLVG